MAECEAHLCWLRQPPSEITAESSFTFALRAENAGAQVWRAGASEADGSVMIGGAFFAGGTRVAFVGGWAELPHAIAPGEGARIAISTNVRGLAPGPYLLRVDAVQLGRGFFGEFGSSPLEVSIEVVAPDESEQLWDRALRHCTNIWTPSAGVRRARGTRLPLFAASASGARVRDLDGREYLDFIMGWGTATLGYDHPELREAVLAHLGVGPTLPLPHPLQVAVAEQLCALLPGAERVLFGKNGSDVLEAALRIARAHTGRDHVLCCGFHGFHDWYLASVPGVAGTPAALREVVHAVPYGDLDAVRAQLDRHAGEVAALVIEPASLAYPVAGYLETLREWTREAGVLLVFDEIMSAFRLANGGATEVYGVQPDLMAVGKGIANGYPLAALVGPRVYMDHAFEIGYGPTFQGEVHALAAAHAALRVYARERVCEHLCAAGETLRDGILTAARRHGIALVILGITPRQVLEFARVDPFSAVLIRTFVVQELLEAGILCAGTLLPSLAHTAGDLEHTIATFDAVFEHLAAAIADASLADRVEIPLTVHFLGEDAES